MCLLPVLDTKQASYRHITVINVYIYEPHIEPMLAHIHVHTHNLRIHREHDHQAPTKMTCVSCPCSTPSRPHTGILLSSMYTYMSLILSLCQRTYVCVHITCVYTVNMTTRRPP